jgi:glycosyltransferase involved in cell wall biosynthesis
VLTLQAPSQSTQTRQPLSVVVPTRDRPELLDGCLASLSAALDPRDELIVVDSASRDPEVREVVLRHRAVYVRCDIPGASVARNAGWRRARHDLIAFADDDARVSPDWADTIAALFAGDPSLAFVTGRIDVPDDEAADRPVAVITEEAAREFDVNTRGPLGQSANMAIRRGALERLGGFDEAMGPGSARGAIAEDVDLYDRALCVGLRGRYDPSVRAWHRQWRDRRALLKLDWHYGLGAGFRVAKLVRLERRRAWVVAGNVMWDWSLKGVVPALRQGYEYGAAYRLIRMGGAIVGFVEALTLPVRDGHYVDRRRPWAPRR